MIAVIQAGGKGTRITSVTEDKIPKPMLDVANKPILYHQIMNLKKYNIDEIIIIVSHLGNIIKDYFKNGEDLGVKISYIEESPDNPLGTAGALYYLKNTIQDDFIFLLGDVFINIDFKRFIAFHQSHNGKVTLLTHPNNHPFDSDLIITNNDLVTDINYKNNVRTNYHNLVNAGIMIFNHTCLDFITELKKYNYEKDIIYPLIQEKMVYSYKSSEYVKDTGTPERYAQVIRDYYQNIPNTKNLSNRQKCIFINRDNIIENYSNQNTNDFELLSNVSQLLKIINESGYLCILITEKQNRINSINERLETILGENNAYVDDILCYESHEEITKIIDKYHIDVTKSYMICNTNSDSEFAQIAGLKPIFLISSETTNLHKKLNRVLKTNNK